MVVGGDKGDDETRIREEESGRDLSSKLVSVCALVPGPTSNEEVWFEAVVVHGYFDVVVREKRGEAEGTRAGEVGFDCPGVAYRYCSWGDTKYSEACCLSTELGTGECDGREEGCNDSETHGKRG